MMQSVTSPKSDRPINQGKKANLSHGGTGLKREDESWKEGRLVLVRVPKGSGGERGGRRLWA